jgi:hypothetical protein
MMKTWRISPATVFLSLAACSTHAAIVSVNNMILIDSSARPGVANYVAIASQVVLSGCRC